MAAPVASDGRVRPIGPDRWLVDGTLLGLSRATLLEGTDQTFGITLPKGVAPMELQGIVQAGEDDELTGTEPVSPGETSVQIGLPGQTPISVTATDAAFALPLLVSPSPPDPNAVDVVAHISTTAICRPVVRRLSELAVIAAGRAETPATLADFFPPTLDRLVISMDEALASDRSVAKAVLDLTASTALAWPASRVVVSTSLAESVATLNLTPFDRVVELRAGFGRRVALEPSTVPSKTVLALVGKTTDLPSLVAFVTSAGFRATFTTEKRPAQMTVKRAAIAPFVTLGDLRIGPVTARSFGSVDAPLTVEQSRLGGQVSSIAVSITGVARSQRTGNVLIQLRANDRVLATKRVVNDEQFEISASISRTALRRDNDIVVRASEMPDDNAGKDTNVIDDGCPQGHGGGLVSIELDPGSSFEGTHGRGVAVGFERFPQELVPGFDVRFGALGIDELRSAAGMIELLQKRSPVLLIPRVAASKESIDSNRPLFYVGSRRPEIAKLGLPIAFAKQASVAGPLTALQAFEAGRHDNLALLTEGPSASLGALLDAPRVDARGWLALRGDALVEQRGRSRNLRVRPAIIARPPGGRGFEGSRIRGPLLYGFGVGAAIATLVVIAKRRQSRR